MDFTTFVNRKIILLAIVSVVLVVVIIGSISFMLLPNTSTHNIIMTTQYVIINPGDGLDNRDSLAYKMISHEIENNRTHETTDVTTTRYGSDPKAIVPGPTLIINKGDTVNLTIQNGLRDGCVSVHVHGLSFDINNDGTLKAINGVSDQCATPKESWSYTWYAGKDSGGSWPYHDHTYCNKFLQNNVNCEKFEGVAGAEEIGLYGVIIVNEKKTQMVYDGKVKNIKTKDIAKDYILFMDGNAQFHGTSIDNITGLQTPVGVNPTLSAEEGSYVRWTIIGVGSEFHTFHLHSNKWQETADTTSVVDTVNIGPFEKHTFVIKAGGFGGGKGDWQYHCHLFNHMTVGMAGIFKVT